MHADDEQWMRLALALARKGLGKTAPNPCVGAVMVSGGKIVGRGWHKRAGGPHAEIEALRDAGRHGFRDFGRATLFVTLEPCCTRGRTPPCTDAIVSAGLGRVVIGATDPNPRHAGRAFGILRRAGVAVTHGVLAGECAALNRAFNHWIIHKKPWLVAKAALTLDGALTLAKNRRVQLTGGAAARDAHRLRAGSDAILAGAATVRIDNPRLTARGVPVARQPLRVTVTRSGKLPRRLHFFADANHVVYHNQPWGKILRDLGRRGVMQLLVEGGADVHRQLARKKLVNEVVLYYAPVLAAGADLPRAGALRSLPLTEPTLTVLGRDLKLHGLVKTGR
ncbi:MAG: bifunctional diaminohydroxyphosphoribosylaminopyrimidine deaminase/5-amino-6-(5-phosphoribosylamino)uracil reductase RibD [Verrucomicrobiales bacterium]|jgi:diaminohydroxyphosphoribosylaminopyrimidine deaminase/5-amino-6-(5-phosphoribosylamino)uracil reductase|nr:bifunctional diaminohydroxyphosphoribosylaminopyrimidine deaminase/5-amino-6-(5-phosphoribosylamino)uracil reductase RibD [Verrucomicrobiales bacterium]